MAKNSNPKKGILTILLLSLLIALNACGKTSPSDFSTYDSSTILVSPEPNDVDSDMDRTEEEDDSGTIKNNAFPSEETPKIIVLDPGHASVRTLDQEPVGPGSTIMKNASVIGTRGVSTGRYEYQLVLDVCLKLQSELISRGYTVVMTRENSEQALSNVQRAEIANSVHADVFLRIHADASESSADSGATAICITEENPFVAQYYEDSRLLSECLLEAYCSETKMMNGGVHERDDMTGNNWSNMASCLFELGYMTNPQDDINLCDPEFQDKMILGIANGLDRFFMSKLT